MTSFPPIVKALLLNAVSRLCVGREWFGSLAAESPEVFVPHAVIYDGRELALLRPLYREGQEPVVSAVRALCESADAALDITPLSVTQKPAPPPGGTLNNYYSLAKYWWPDDASPDGLPKVSYDAARLVEFAEAVHTLALAAYLGGPEHCATKAVGLLEARRINAAADFAFRVRPSDTAAGGCAPTRYHQGATPDVGRRTGW